MIRRFFILIIPMAAGILLSTARAQLSFNGWEPDYDRISKTGQQLFEQFAPPAMQQTHRVMTADELSNALRSMQTVLQGNDMHAVARMHDYAAQTLQWLRANPNMKMYADWLSARMDYFDVAQLAETTASRPTTPTVSSPVTSKPLPPHPTTPSPAPAVPALDAQSQYAKDKQTWIDKLKGRSAPSAAAGMLPSLKKIFREAGLPEALVWQAEAESSFNAAARSPVGAVGLYQFMPATAEQYGLKLSPKDERLDPYKNAAAATRYLTYLHKRFGNWPLALAAYNCGEGRVSRTMKQTGGKTFADIQSALPAETRMYVPKIAALLHLREGVDLDRL